MFGSTSKKGFVPKPAKLRHQLSLCAFRSEIALLIYARQIMYPCKNEDIVETISSTNRTFQESPKSRIFQKLIFKSHNSALFYRY